MKPFRFCPACGSDIGVLTEGRLTGLGMDEAEAKHYDEQFKSGRAVVTVNASERYTEAADILRDLGKLAPDRERIVAAIRRPCGRSRCARSSRR